MFVERDKKGQVQLDPPMSIEAVEWDLAGEMKAELRKRGITDPAAIRRLAAKMMAEDEYLNKPEGAQCSEADTEAE